MSDPDIEHWEKEINELSPEYQKRQQNKKEEERCALINELMPVLKTIQWVTSVYGIIFNQHTLRWKPDHQFIKTVRSFSTGNLLIIKNTLSQLIKARDSNLFQGFRYNAYSYECDDDNRGWIVGIDYNGNEHRI